MGAAKFEWSNSYSVGVTNIDDQHKKLIALINELSTAASSGKGRDVIGNVLKGLVDYTVGHFKMEEELMQKHKYLEYITHKGQHDDLVKQVSDLVNKQKAGSIMVSVETLTFLQHWLTEHINGTDKKLGAYLQSKGVK